MADSHIKNVIVYLHHIFQLKTCKRKWKEVPDVVLAEQWFSSRGIQVSPPDFLI